MYISTYTAPAFLSFLTFFTYLTNAAPAPATAPSPRPRTPRNATLGAAKAVYFLSNEVQNSVVALRVNPEDGTLSSGSVHLTGGRGAAGIDDATNGTAGRDVLFSQSAIRADGDLLAAVNAGSNTVSLFAISPDDATCLRLVGSPASTLGDFPVTVALSARKKLVCVANTGAKAGVACFRASTETGLTPLSTSLITSFDLGQSNPPRGPLNTVSHAFFNADASALITTVKGNPVVNKNSTGFISVLPIHGSCPASKDIRSSPPGTAVLFGSVVIPSGGSPLSQNTTTTTTTTTFLATDASFGATTLSLSLSDSNQHITTLSQTPIANQSATCWAAFSPTTRTVFVTDVGRNRLVEIDPVHNNNNNGTILQQTTLPNKNPGLIDLAAAGRFLYALSPASACVKSSRTAVLVVDVGGKEEGGKREARVVQEFEVEGVGCRAMGMTLVI